ncbi:MAG: hypothetical protein AAB366_01075 [Patescibacteria group bacterium]
MKKKLFLIIGVGLGLVLILTATFVFLSFDITKKTEQIKNLRKKIVSYYRANENLAILRSDLESVQSYLPGIDAFLLNRDQLISFPRDIKSLASQFQVDAVSNFLEAGKGETGDIRWIGVKVIAEGEMSNLTEFLKALENSRYSVGFNSLDFSKAAKGFKATLNGKIFYF